MSVTDPTPNSTGSPQFCHPSHWPEPSSPSKWIWYLVQALQVPSGCCHTALSDKIWPFDSVLGDLPLAAQRSSNPGKGALGSGTQPPAVHGPKWCLWQLERRWAPGSASLRPILLRTAGDLVRQPIHSTSQASPGQPDLTQDPDDRSLAAAAAVKATRPQCP